tara:strand:- start:485 stop:1687 length:1203 start_codon:yes stop_codon:yes gene_type:complete
MATSFKSFLNNDVTTTRTLLHEAIPITGSILSGTYHDPATTTSGHNIKNYSHGLFQSVFDYPHLSSSANHIFDITVGYSNESALSGTTADHVQNADKINVYNQMAQLLVGHDINGTIREFDADGNLSEGTKLRDCFFLNFARLLQKDEIKKGSFTLELGVSGSNDTAAVANSLADFAGANFLQRIQIRDLSGSNGYKTNSPAGEYGILFATSSLTTGVNPFKDTLNPDGKGIPVGLIYYQAGVAVISGSVFKDAGDATGGGVLDDATIGTLQLANPNQTGATGAGLTGNTFITGSSISGSADAFRNRIYNISFNNTTELNSTIYFARAGHNEFNYSSNPTYIDSSSQIRVKNSSLDQPVSYITTVGLYSADNELLAVAKVSEPLKKTPDTELTLRVRLDF